MATEKISYIELPATDIEGTKQFFANAFGWEFIDYGPDYTVISGAGLDGGFYKSTLRATTETGSALVVLYSANLESSLARVESAGGKIVKPIFSFPGGSRFQFMDPSGNEYAVWSE